MSRAILLPTPGSNPFLLQTWLRNYDSWRRPGDRLYVIPTWVQTEERYKVINDMVLERGGVVIYRMFQTLDHGLALDMVIPMVIEDKILLMEDDLYVRNPGAVEFEIDGIIGARRWNGSLELQDKMRERGTSGLWPHLLQASTADMQSVREHWGAHLWKKGDWIRPLKWFCPGEISSDTAVAATIELQLGRSLHEISSPNVEAAIYTSDWFHIGSLSSGPLTRGGTTPLEWARSSPDSWAQRVAWWQRTLRRSVPGMEVLHEIHTEALRALEKACGRRRVAHWQAKYDTLVTWDE